jgi:hypothetical protein
MDRGQVGLRNILHALLPRLIGFGHARQLRLCPAIVENVGSNRLFPQG